MENSLLNICIVRICELLCENPVVLQKENDKIMIYFDKGYIKIPFFALIETQKILRLDLPEILEEMILLKRMDLEPRIRDYWIRQTGVQAAVDSGKKFLVTHVYKPNERVNGFSIVIKMDGHLRDILDRRIDTVNMFLEGRNLKRNFNLFDRDLFVTRHRIFFRTLDCQQKFDLEGLYIMVESVLFKHPNIIPLFQIHEFNI